MSSFAKLQKRDPPARKKVGAWLASSVTSGDVDESEEEEGQNGGPSGRRAGMNGGDDDGKEQGEDEEIEVDEGDEEGEGSDGWEVLLQRATIKLRSGKLSMRLEALERDLAVTSGCECRDAEAGGICCSNDCESLVTAPPSNSAPGLVDLLLSFLPRYSDSKSQEAVVRLLTDLLRRENSLENGQSSFQSLTDTLVDWSFTNVQHQTGPDKTIAASNLYPHLLLSLALYQTLSDTLSSEFAASKSFPKLVTTTALALNEILTPAPKEKERQKADTASRAGKGRKQRASDVTTLGKGAISRTRRAIRNNPRLIPNVFDELLDKSSGSMGSRLMSMIGLTLGVTLRLKGSKSSHPTLSVSDVIPQYKDRLLQAYLDNVLTNKVDIPNHVIGSLDDLWMENEGVLDSGDLKEKVISVGDKLMGKSPEAACPGECLVAHALFGSSRE